MDKLQDLSQSELQDLLDNSERVESMALESDEVGGFFLKLIVISIPHNASGLDHRQEH